MSGSLLSYIQDGDLRTTQGVDDVVRRVEETPELAGELFEGLDETAPEIRMRVADALEKLSQKQPALAEPYVSKLLALAGKEMQQEVQWHIAQILSYVALTPQEKNMARGILLKYFHTSQSVIVKVEALTTLVHLAKDDPFLLPTVKHLLDVSEAGSIPSLQARASALKKTLDSA